MKIVHIVTSLDFGGLERRIEILSRYPSPVNKLYFVALGTGGKTHERLLLNNSNVTCLNCDTHLFKMATFYKLYKYLKKVDPDVVHTHGCEANFYGSIISKLLSVKLLIGEEIGIPNFSVKSKFLFKHIYSLSDRLISMSDTVSNYLIDNKLLDKNKSALVYNPVLMKENIIVGKKQADEIKFIYVGRLELIKNPIGLLKAFKLLFEERNDISLSIVGDGKLKDEMTFYIRDNNLENNVFMLGYCSDPLSIVESHDVFIQPSHTEGFSLALAEAMSCQIPVLCTPCGSAKRLVHDGVNGYLTKSSDVNDLYDGLVNMLNKKKNFLIMGINARKAVIEEHNPKLYSQKLDDFYMTLLD